MSRESEFLIYCMERYRYYKKLSGKEVAEIFEKSGVNEYIISNCSVLLRIPQS